MTKARKWEAIAKEKVEELRNLIISRGGIQDAVVKGISEVWRIRVRKTVFTMYDTGTLFSTAPSDPVAEKLHDEIHGVVGIKAEVPSKSFLLGLDETGKGEVLGHSVLVGAVIPSSLVGRAEEIVNLADTKKKKTVSYWDALFVELDGLRRDGLDFVVEKVPPWDVDRYNLNKIMDIVYQRIVSQLTRRVPIADCRVVFDDYGIGANLSKYLASLAEKGTEVRTEKRADERYVEVKLASAIAKREREKVMEAINKKFSLPGFPVGSGNAGDMKTLKWLGEWKKTGQEWPWFVKQSFNTMRQIDGKTEEVKKQDPPVRHDLLAPDSRDLFGKGKLSVESLGILCAKCGEVMKSCKVTPYDTEKLVGRCIRCNEIIGDLGITLRYYCGHVVPDSSVIISGTIAKDLEKGRFFEGFTFLIPPIVRQECDNKGGRKELGKLADFSSIGRIDLFDIPPAEIHGTGPDAQVVDASKKYNAIVFTQDRGMYELAISSGVFCLTK